MPLVEDDRVAQRDRPGVVGRRIDEIEDRARARAVPEVPVDRRRPIDDERWQSGLHAGSIACHAGPRPRGCACARRSSSGPFAAGFFAGFSFEAGAQARHQIDHVRRLRGLARLEFRLASLHLGLDDLQQVVAVLVGVFLRVPLCGEIVDQLQGHLHLRRADSRRLGKLEVGEIGELVRKAHHREHDRVPDDLDGRQCCASRRIIFAIPTFPDSRIASRRSAYERSAPLPGWR